MSHLTHKEVQHHVKIYLCVFAALAVFTVLTVTVSRFHLPVYQAITVALAIATIKASLVAAFFMHLRWEKLIVYSLLALTFVFFLALLLLPAGARL